MSQQSIVIPAGQRLSHMPVAEPVDEMDAARRGVRVGWLTVMLATVLFVNMLPVTMIVPGLTRLKETFHTTSFWSHVFMSINMIAAVLAAPMGAALSDRLGRRKPILIIALLLNAAALLCMGYLSTVKPILWALLVFRFWEGAAHMVALTTIMALACDWAAPGKRGRMMGLIGAALMFGTAFGALLGGRIANASTGAVFYVGTGLALIAASMAALGLRDAPGRGRSSGFRDTCRLVTMHRVLLIPYAYAFIDRFCVGVIVSTLMLYLGVVVGLTPAGIGGLLAMFLFPFALLCYPVGRLADRFGRVAPMCIGSIGFGLVFALYGVMPFDWLYAGMFASGILSAIMFAPNLAMCSDLAPMDLRATAFAGFNVAGSLGFMTGPIIAAALCALFEPSYGSAFAYKLIFIVAGTAEVVCAIVTLPSLLKLSKQTRTT